MTRSTLPALRNRRGRLAGLILAALGLSVCAEAQVARVFVSVNGNDGNVCSNVATPCRNYAAAISQVDERGEVIVLDSGTYEGLTINKGVTIRAPRGVVAHSNSLFAIDAPGKSVKLIGLTINPPFSSGFPAIEFFNGDLLYIERCLFHNWYYALFSHTGRAVVVDCVIFDVLNTALVVNNGAHLVVLNSRIEGFNISANDAIADVRECVVEAGQYGVTASSSVINGYALLTADKCVLMGQVDAVGAFASASGATGNVVVARSTITDCQSASFTNGGTIFTYGNVQSHGNTGNTVGSVVLTPR